jgi:uncharacterized repeat protein (TIGR03803 family)
LYGTTSEGGGPLGNFGTIFAVTLSGEQHTLYRFCPVIGCVDGQDPVGTLVEGSDGNLYGTTQGGGANDNDGTIFSISTTGTFTSLYSFCSQANCADGASPRAGLIQGSDGNFYGTTFGGGSFSGECSETGCGTVFKFSPSTGLTTLYTFGQRANCADGGFPQGALIQGGDGNFYGTTVGGGANKDGTIFEVTPTGKLTTLHSFCEEANCADGSSPWAGLVQAADGTFYGTTFTGGSGTACKGNPCGTVFSFAPGSEDSQKRE